MRKRQSPASRDEMLETVFFVYGFQEEWLQCHRIDQERSIRDDKKKLEQAKKRLSDLDVIISRLYENYVLGNLSQDRYKKMAADYEDEQERLKLEIEVIEEWMEQREEMNDGLDAFIALTQKYVDVEELTQTIVNEYIKKIIVYAPDKSSGKRKQKVKIFSTSWMMWIFPLFPNLSSRKQPMNAEKRRDLQVTPFSATK